jgi:rhodanese-related sulfurtransferase
MKIKIAAFTVLLAFVLGVSYCGQKETPKQSNLAKLCSTCHKDEPGVMRAYLENIAVKSGTIMMDLQTRKEVVKFKPETPFENVKDVNDVRNYLGKGFKIEFEEKDGQKYAKKVKRFDILSMMDAKDKLTKDEFKKLMKQKNVFVFDARPINIYKEGHIPGSKPLPAPAFEKFKDKLPADKNATIIFYCVGGCLSPSAALNAKKLGYTNIKIYIEGIPDWVKTEYTHTTPDFIKESLSTGMPFVLIDVRPVDKLKAGFIKTAVSIPLAKLDAFKAQFPKKKNAPIVIYGDGAEAAATKIVSWGHKAVRILPDSFEKFDGPKEKGTPSSKIVFVPKQKPGTISLEEFNKVAEGKTTDTVIIDVRNKDEYVENSIKGSINIPLDDLAHELKSIPEGKKVVVICSTGVRASMGFTTLQTMKFDSRYLDAQIEYGKEKGKFKLTEN